jgi:hypothetical protein
VRKPVALSLLLTISGCMPPAVPGRDGEPSAEVLDGRHPVTLECRAELEREEVAFQTSPDRRADYGCSVLGAVRVTGIGTRSDGIAAMKCPLARQYARWVRDIVQPAARQLLGSPVSRIESLGTYACRPVNGREGARLSEHGLANAVDIAAFRLADGRRVTVLAGWSGEDERIRTFLRTAHRGGCRLFRIAMGPESNALHRDHLHFDMGRGRYCR